MPFDTTPPPLQVKFQYGMYGTSGNLTAGAVRRFWGLESVVGDLRTVCPVGRLATALQGEGAPVYR